MRVETIKTVTKGDISDLKAYANAIDTICQNCKFKKLERDLSGKHYCDLTNQNIKENHFCSWFEANETLINFIKKETND